MQFERTCTPNFDGLNNYPSLGSRTGLRLGLVKRITSVTPTQLLPCDVAGIRPSPCPQPDSNGQACWHQRPQLLWAACSSTLPAPGRRGDQVPGVLVLGTDTAAHISPLPRFDNVEPQISHAPSTSHVLDGHSNRQPGYSPPTLPPLRPLKKAQNKTDTRSSPSTSPAGDQRSA